MIVIMRLVATCVIIVVRNYCNLCCCLFPLLLLFLFVLSQIFQEDVMYDPDITEKDLKEKCCSDMYPPRFCIRVSGKRDSPEVVTTFKFTGTTRNLRSQVILECTGKYCMCVDILCIH